MFKPIAKSFSKITPKYKLDEFGVYEKKDPDYTTVHKDTLPPEKIHGEEVFKLFNDDDDDDDNYDCLEGVDLIKEIPKGEYSEETKVNKSDDDEESIESSTEEIEGKITKNKNTGRYW